MKRYTKFVIWNAAIIMAFVMAHVVLFIWMFEAVMIRTIDLRVRNSPGPLDRIWGFRQHFYSGSERLAGLAVIVISCITGIVGLISAKRRLALLFPIVSIIYLALSLGPGAEIPDSLPITCFANRLFLTLYPASSIRTEFETCEDVGYVTEMYYEYKKYKYAHFLRLFHVAVSAVLGAMAVLLALVATCVVRIGRNWVSARRKCYYGKE